MMRKTLGALTLMSLLLASGCGFVEPPPFNPQTLEQMQKAQIGAVISPEMRPLPTTLPAVVGAQGNPLPRPSYATTQPIGPELPMTLGEIIHRAVANNYQVRVAGYQAAIDEVRILEAEARFDPSVFVTPTLQRTYGAGGVSTTTPTEVLSQSLEAGFRQTLPSGGQVQISDRATRNEITSPGSLFASAGTETVYENQVIMQVTQPLLQNFGAEVNRARITVARNDQKISALEFRKELEQVLSDIEQAYWQEVRAIQEVQILQELLRNTENTLDILIKRLRQDVSMVQVAQARATVETRNAALIAARSRIGDLSDQLKRLMNDPDLTVASPVVLVPADRPVQQPLRFALSDLIETALQNRLELLEQKLRIDTASTIVKAAKNNALPQLNFVGSLGFQGLGDDFGEALRSQGDLDFVNYSAGFQFEVPIGNRANRAIYQRTLLQRQQAIDQYRGLAEQVALDVTTAQRAVLTAWDQMVANRLARLAAEQALQAIEQREAAGEALTPTFVQLKLDRQASLADAQVQEIVAVTNYNIALANLERAKGTLLPYNNVVLKEAVGPAFMEIAP